MMIVCGATIFCYILSFERFPQMVANFFLTYVDNKYLALLVINIFLVFVGMFMDSSPVSYTHLGASGGGPGLQEPRVHGGED